MLSARRSPWASVSPAAASSQPASSSASAARRPAAQGWEAGVAACRVQGAPAVEQRGLAPDGRGRDGRGRGETDREVAQSRQDAVQFGAVPGHPGLAAVDVLQYEGDTGAVVVRAEQPGHGRVRREGGRDAGLGAVHVRGVRVHLGAHGLDEGPAAVREPDPGGDAGREAAVLGAGLDDRCAEDVLDGFAYGGGQIAPVVADTLCGRCAGGHRAVPSGVTGAWSAFQVRGSARWGRRSPGSGKGPRPRGWWSD